MILIFLSFQKFSKEVGETYKIHLWPEMEWSEKNILYTRVDSISYVYLDTIELRVQHVTHSTDSLFPFQLYSWRNLKIIENIGSSQNLLIMNDNSFCDGRYNMELRCFNHPDLGLLNLKG